MTCVRPGPPELALSSLRVLKSQRRWWGRLTWAREVGEVSKGFASALQWRWARA